jgi:hypothetical protein
LPALTAPRSRILPSRASTGGAIVLVTIGRPLPAAADLQDLAAAVTGKPLVAGSTVVQECQILSGSLAGRIVKRRVYAEPAGDMIRQAVTEASIIQAVGRVRGVNRTAETPVEVFLILDDVVIPGLPVDEAVEFTSIEPDAIDQMLARGLEPELPTDARKLYPDLFPSREAAKKAYRRDRLAGGRGRRLGTFPYEENSLIGPCPQPPCVEICFQPQGRG